MTREPAGVAEAVARSALAGSIARSGPSEPPRLPTASARPECTSTSSAPAWPACPPRSRCSEAGQPSRSRGGTGRRRALPVVFRPRTRAAHRQRQPSAAVGQPRGLRLSRHDRRARDARDAGRADVPVHRPGDAASAGCCGRTAGGIPWWVLSRKAPGAGHACRRLTLPCCGCAAPTSDATVADRCARHALPPAARAAGGRGAEHAARHRPRRGCSRAVMRETLLRGGSACIPAVPREGLSESLIDPAVRLAAGRGARSVTAGASPRCGWRTAGWRPLATDRCGSCRTRPWCWPCRPGSPPTCCRACGRPTAFEAILNIHFRYRGGPRPGRLHRPDRRHGGVGVRQARARLGHDQRRQPHGGRRPPRRSRARSGRTCARALAPARARCRPGAW